MEHEICRWCHLVLKKDNPLAASSGPALTSAGPSSDRAPLSMTTLPGSPATPKLHSENILPDTFYRPQRSCGQGNVFTNVCLSTGGRVPASVHAGMPDPPGSVRHSPWTRQTPPRPGRHPPDQAPSPPRDWTDTPQTRHPPGPGRHPPQEADSSIRSTSGRYASYWNAFLFF